MPSSFVRHFTDPDDFAAAIRQSSVQLTVTGHGHYTGKITRIDLHRLWMQRFSESLSRVAKMEDQGGRAVLSFWTNPGPGTTLGGSEIRPGEILRHKVGRTAFQQTSGATASAAMSLPLDYMDLVGGVIAGSDIMPPAADLIAKPRPAAIRKLEKLHAEAEQLAETAPEVIADPEAARGLEQALIEAMMGCLSTGETAEERSARRRHELVMRRFHRIIEDQPDQPLYVPEVCKAISVAERTLRLCCRNSSG